MRTLFEAPSPVERLEEIRRFVEEADSPPLSSGLEFPERSVLDGYAEWAGTYDATPNPLIQVEQPAVEALLEPLTTGRALDAACGTGRLSRLLVARGHDVLGVDGNPEMVAVARERVPEAQFERGSLERLPVGESEFDVVTCGLAVAHLKDLQPAVDELARVTKRGGRVIISDIHPFAVLMAGQAGYQTADGRWGFVRSHFHAHSDYLYAFDHAGLSICRCLEPCHSDETAKALPSFAVAPEATREALVGLPFALVWELERVG